MARSCELFKGSRVESFGPSPQVTTQLGKGRGWTPSYSYTLKLCEPWNLDHLP